MDEAVGYDGENNKGVLLHYSSALPPSQPVSIPTITEWGMIIFMVLAGLGAVYYLRKQRRTS
jgi:hypothetical protein